MTTHRQKRMFYFECDKCADVLETDERDFATAKDHLTKEGWIARRNGNDWEHYCPKCG